MALPAENIRATACGAHQSYGALAADHDLLCRSVRAAGAIALDYFNRGMKGWDKRPGEPVSEADLAVDEFLKKELREARPDYGWLSEESEQHACGGSHARVFVVDPIDGTRSFLRHRPEFAVSVAIVADGLPLLGCVYNPATGEFFDAVAGHGARCNGSAVSVSRKVGLDGAKLLVSWREFQKLCEGGAFVGCEMAPIGSIAYKIALVAAGTANAVVALAPKNDWDLAAADLILREAGGRLTDSQGHTLLYCGTGHRSVVAADPLLHAQLLARLSHI